MSLQTNWSMAAVQKSMASGIASLSVKDAGIPVVSGRLILPPYIEKEGELFQLQRLTDKENITTVITVPENKGASYFYTLADPKVDREQAKEDYKDFLFSTKQNSPVYKKLIEEIESFGLFDAEQDISHIEFSAYDKPIIELFERLKAYYVAPDSVSSHNFEFGKQLESAFRFLEKYELAEPKDLKVIRDILYLGTKTDLNMKEVFSLLGKILEELKQKPLPLVQLHGLLWYRLSTMSEKLHNHEMSGLHSSLIHTHNLLSYRYLVTDFYGKRIECINPEFLGNLLVLPIMRQAAKESYCSEMEPALPGYEHFCVEDVNFNLSPGISKRAGEILNRLFTLSTEVSIKINGKQYLEVLEKDETLEFPAEVKIETDVGTVEFKIFEPNKEFFSVLNSRMTPELLTTYMSNTSSYAVDNIYEVNAPLPRMAIKPYVTVTIADKVYKLNALVSFDKANNHRSKMGSMYYGWLHDESEAPLPGADATLTYDGKMIDPKDLSAFIQEKTESLLGGGFANSGLLSYALSAKSAITSGESLVPEIKLTQTKFYKIFDGMNIDTKNAEKYYRKYGYIPSSYGSFFSHAQAHSARLLRQNAVAEHNETQDYKNTESKLIRTMTQFLNETFSIGGFSGILSSIQGNDEALIRKTFEASFDKIASEVVRLYPTYKRIIKALGIEVPDTFKQEFVEYANKLITNADYVNFRDKVLSGYLNLVVAQVYAKDMVNSVRHRPVLIDISTGELIDPNIGLSMGDIFHVILNDEDSDEHPYRLGFIGMDNEMTVSLSLLNGTRGMSYSPGIMDYSVDVLEFDRENKTSIIRTDTFKYRMNLERGYTENNIDNTLSMSRKNVKLLTDIINANTKYTKKLVFMDGVHLEVGVQLDDKSYTPYVVTQYTHEDIEKLINETRLVPRSESLEDDEGKENSIEVVKCYLKLASHYPSKEAIQIQAITKAFAFEYIKRTYKTMKTKAEALEFLKDNPFVSRFGKDYIEGVLGDL